MTASSSSPPADRQRLDRRLLGRINSIGRPDQQAENERKKKHHQPATAHVMSYGPSRAAGRPNAVGSTADDRGAHCAGAAHAARVPARDPEIRGGRPLSSQSPHRLGYVTGCEHKERWLWAQATAIRATVSTRLTSQCRPARGRGGRSIRHFAPAATTRS